MLSATSYMSGQTGCTPDAMITFQGTQKIGNSSVSTLGTIDRVNGNVDVTNMATNLSPTVYALKCRPTQRLF